MIYCFDKDCNFEYTNEEKELARTVGTAILYDKDTGNFTDFESNPVDIKGCVLFPRTGSTQIYDMNDAIVKSGGTPVITNEEIDKIISWPEYVLVNRIVKVYKGYELLDSNVIAQLESNLGKEIFFKTKKKDFSDIVDISLLKNQNCVFYKALDAHKDDEFIVSEAVEVLSDELGIEEYRVFVINGSVMNISRMTTNVFHKVPSDVCDYVSFIVASLKGKFPTCYSFDVFRVNHNGNKKLDISEFNPIHAAGPYLYNSIVTKTNDLEHSNMEDISYEFRDNIDECVYDGQVINNRINIYRIPKSFSVDLRSIAIHGNLGLTFTTYPMNKAMYANTKPLFASFTPLESDDDLLGGRSLGDTEKLISDANNKVLGFTKKDENK